MKINNRGEYHDLYVQSDKLLLADVYENFRNMCFDIYGLDPVYFLSAPGLAWQACLKKTEVKLELLTYYDMILVIEKGIRGGICQATHRHAEANNKYMKNYDKKHWVIHGMFRRKWFEIVEKLICSIEHKEKYVIHIRANIKKGTQYKSV